MEGPPTPVTTLTGSWGDGERSRSGKAWAALDARPGPRFSSSLWQSPSRGDVSSRNKVTRSTRSRRRKVRMTIYPYKASLKA